MTWSGRFWLLFSVYLLSLSLWQYTALDRADQAVPSEIDTASTDRFISPDIGYLPGINYIYHQPPTLQLNIKILGDFWLETPGFNSFKELTCAHSSNILPITVPFIISLGIKRIIFPFHTFH